MKISDYKRVRVCYKVYGYPVDKHRSGHFKSVLVYVDHGIKTPWNDAKALGLKELRKENPGEEFKYIDLRTEQFGSGHLYEFPGREKLLTEQEIDRALLLKGKTPEEKKALEEEIENDVRKAEDEHPLKKATQPSSYSQSPKSGEEQIQFHIKHNPPKDYEPSTIEEADKKMMRVIFWVFVVVIGFFALAVWLEWI